MIFVTTKKIFSTAGLAFLIAIRFPRSSLGAILIALSIFSTSLVHADSIDMATRVDLQLGLSNYIDSRTADSGYEHFNVETGKIQKLTLKKLHPLIFANGNKYMMCADFLDTNGNDVLLDYIVSLSGTGFRVEQEIPGRRSYMQQLFERIY